VDERARLELLESILQEKIRGNRNCSAEGNSSPASLFSAVPNQTRKNNALMIEINHKQQLATQAAVQVPIKVVGLGGAGLNVIDRIVLDGAVPGADLLVMNTDVQSLTSSVASQKVQIGRGVTRGLGAGGDP
jgi:hypothetical protein